jgi:exopolysaccharide production protein ExoZ
VKEVKYTMIKSIQSLRAVAALCVVLLTCGGWFAHEYPDRYENPFLLGNSGVDLFFIISGFIMTFSIHAAPAMGARLFMARRLIRIVPLYWIMSTLFLLLALFIPQMFRLYTFDPWHAALSYLFIPQDTLPVIRTGWTLAYEMYFYLLLTVFLAAGLRSKLYGVAAFFAASYLLGLSLPQYQAYPIFGMLTSELLFEFVMGMLLFYAYQKGFRIGVPAAAAFMASGVLLFHLLDGSMRLLSFGVPMAFIFGGVIFCRREMLNFRPLHLMGDASYSLYLVQVLAVPACGKIVRKLPIDAYAFSIPLMALYLCAAVAASLVLYLFLERPITDLLKKGLQGETNTGGPASAYPREKEGPPDSLPRAGEGR